MRLIVFTMLFSGGLIPTYLIVKGLGMTNRIWAMVIPNAVSAWNLIIARTYLQQSIPQELLEAALVDGCSYTRFFSAVVVPLSGAIIAVLALLYSVAHWNSFFTGLIYLQDYAKYPLQLVLRDILLGYQASSGATDDAKTLQEMQRIADLMKYALILVASLPGDGPLPVPAAVLRKGSHDRRHQGLTPRAASGGARRLSGSAAVP